MSDANRCTYEADGFRCTLDRNHHGGHQAVVYLPKGAPQPAPPAEVGDVLEATMANVPTVARVLARADARAGRAQAYPPGAYHRSLALEVLRALREARDDQKTGGQDE